MGKKTLQHIRIINREEDEIKQVEMGTPLLAKDWCGWDLASCADDVCILDYA